MLALAAGGGVADVGELDVVGGAAPPARVELELLVVDELPQPTNPSSPTDRTVLESVCAERIFALALALKLMSHLDLLGAINLLGPRGRPILPGGAIPRVLRVIDLEGQLIRELTLDPSRNYQPLAHR